MMMTMPGTSQSDVCHPPAMFGQTHAKKMGSSWIKYPTTHCALSSSLDLESTEEHISWSIGCVWRTRGLEPLKSCHTQYLGNIPPHLLQKHLHVNNTW
jgi:hypothetical protein